MYLLKKSAVFAALASIASANQCLPIDHENAPLRKIVTHLSVLKFDYDDVFGKGGIGNTILGFLPSSISKCVANYDGDHIPAILPTLSTKCLPMIAAAEKNQAMKDFGANLPDLTNIFTTWGEFVDYYLKAPNKQYEEVCELATDELAPCIESVAPLLMDAFKKNSNGCCQEMFEGSVATTGDEPGKLISDVTGLGLDTFCGSRTPGFKENKEQTCVYTFMHVMMDPDVMQTVGNVLTAVQVPNENACDAFTGQEFETTKGLKSVLGNPQEGVAFDACSVQMDAFASKFAKMPLMSKTPLKELFANGNCFELTTERLSFLDNFGPLAPILKGILTGQCVNLANGYSNSCQYTATSTSNVGPNKKQDSLTKDDGPKDDNKKDEDKNAGFQQGPMLSMMLLVIASILALF